MTLTQTDIEAFQHTVLLHGKQLYRDMPWRTDCNPYYILLSEIMLQQTQVPRVLQKFEEFIAAFPTIESLAYAEFVDVLHCWSGLGYNRRAKYLHEAAKQIHSLGHFPTTIKDLERLPGIGPNTAASILVYAFNEPLTFIETNVRTVYIYYFFEHTTTKVSEKELFEIIQQTVYSQNPRQWYWALMDYGTHIKKTIGNFNAKSNMYTTQSKFEGSNRQKRAMILRFLMQHGAQTADAISFHLDIPDDLTIELLTVLCSEGMIQNHQKEYSIS